ncbi:MAG: PorV/PorQ family protein [bacterium]
MNSGRDRSNGSSGRQWRYAVAGFCFFCLLLLFCMSSPARAELKTGAAFLKIPVGARAVGMGNAFTAKADDMTAIYWNPGGLAALSSREAGGTHTELYQDMKYDFAGYAHPLSAGTLAGSFARLSSGNMEGRGEAGEKLSDFTASDMVFSLAFARKMHLAGLPIGAGASAKFIQSRIADSHAETFAFDLGAAYQAGDRVGIGLAVQNIGPGLKFMTQSSPLPLSVVTGFSYSLQAGLSLSADVKHEPRDKRTSVSAGAEYSPFPAICLRTGYTAAVAGGLRHSTDSKKFTEQFKGLGAGLGINFRPFALDYSFSPFGEIGDAQRVSLSARF